MLALKEQQAGLHCFVLYRAQGWERIPFSTMLCSKEPQGSETWPMSHSNSSHWPSWDLDRHSATLAESTFAF